MYDGHVAGSRFGVRHCFYLFCSFPVGKQDLDGHKTLDGFHNVLHHHRFSKRSDDDGQVFRAFLLNLFQIKDTHQVHGQRVHQTITVVAHQGLFFFSVLAGCRCNGIRFFLFH